MTVPTELTVYVKQLSFTHALPTGSSLRLGRGARVHVRIDDPSVSREHVELHVGPSGVEVEDLGSSNGTELFSGTRREQGEKLKPGRRYAVGSGDVVRVGSVPILFQRAREVVLADQTTTPPPSGSERILFDPEMKRIYELASRAALSDIGVLITGETGVGKEVLAAFVHERSHRASRPFLQLNCAALSESLLESELFGHEKGAFTGAQTLRAGLLESAQGGTVFLDEIGEMPLSTQAKLLRVLEERQVRRLGSNKKTPIDVRFVAATNRDLEAEVNAGRFRGDLYYRISGITLFVPPLRARRSEVEVFARHFLHSFCLRSGIGIPEISPAALEALFAYPWPGNVRELKNAMERAPFLSSGAPILPEHLPSLVLEPTDDEFPDEATDVRMMPLGMGGRAGIPRTTGAGKPAMPSPLHPRSSETASLRELLRYSAADGPAPNVASPLPLVEPHPTAPHETAPHQAGLEPAGADGRDDDFEEYLRSRARPPTPSAAAASGWLAERQARFDAAGPSHPAPSAPLTHGNSKNFSEDLERQRVLDALEACCGNQTRAAKMLGVSRRTLINRIEAFGLPRPRKYP